MRKLITAAAEFQQFCVERGWQFCFIGGLAVLHWGEPRLTQDVDATLLTGFGGEREFVDQLLGVFLPRRPDAAQFAIENRVLLVTTKADIDLDISLGGLPYEQTVVARSSRIDFGRKVTLRICSAEDLVVLKAFADRPRDWSDVEGVLVRQGAALDWSYINAALEPLAVGTDRPELLDRLRALRREVEAAAGGDAP